jgi:hypothetical protein
MLIGALLVGPGSSAAPPVALPSRFEASGTVLLSRSPTTTAVDAIQDSANTNEQFEVVVGPAPRPLYPGLRVRIPLTFTNSQSIPLSVRTAALSAVGPDACPAETNLNLGRRTFVHRTVVRPDRIQLRYIGLRMYKTAADGCQNATFQLTVHATAVRAS